MKAPEHLRKPQNWQDFEKLCQKLWVAIWNNPEGIELNSTNEQGQNGVDMYCWIDSENGYVGIQCKGKKDEKIDGTENRITLTEIKKEIEKAETFEPALKRYIIATTAEKDGDIQKEVRKIDAERRSQGKFSVEIKFWDYISSKTDEHKQVHDWYVKSQNFKSNQSIKFTFSDGSEEITCIPLFQKTTTTYHQMRPKRNIFDMVDMADMANISWPSSGVKYNKSFVRVQLKIKNTGELPIETWKIRIRVEGPFKEINKTNKIAGHYEFAVPSHFPDFTINKYPPQIILYKPRPIDTIVSGDEYIFDEIFIKPGIQEKSVIEFHWELLSQNYKDSGKLILKLEPKVEQKEKRVLTNDYVEANKSPETSEIEDFICDNNEED